MPLPDPVDPPDPVPLPAVPSKTGFPQPAMPTATIITIRISAPLPTLVPPSLDTPAAQDENKLQSDQPSASVA